MGPSTNKSKKQEKEEVVLEKKVLEKKNEKDDQTSSDSSDEKEAERQKNYTKKEKIQETLIREDMCLYMPMNNAKFVNPFQPDQKAIENKYASNQIVEGITYVKGYPLTIDDAVKISSIIKDSKCSVEHALSENGFSTTEGAISNYNMIQAVM